MPQTPSFFIPREVLLYNLLAGQRLSLRSGAASATQPVGRTQLNVGLSAHCRRISCLAAVLDAREESPTRAARVAGLSFVRCWLADLPW